jgi:hypothetical protein
MRSCSSRGNQLIERGTHVVAEAVAAADNGRLSDFRLLKGIGEGL